MPDDHRPAYRNPPKMSHGDGMFVSRKRKIHLFHIDSHGIISLWVFISIAVVWLPMMPRIGAGRVRLDRRLITDDGPNPRFHPAHGRFFHPRVRGHLACPSCFGSARHKSNS